MSGNNLLCLITYKDSLSYTSIVIASLWGMNRPVYITFMA